MTSTAMSPNHREAVNAVSTLTGKTEYITSTNGALSVNASVSVAGTNANCYTGQKTVSTSAVQISGVSNTLTNGIIIKAPSTNAAIIYVGLVGVTTSTGDILEPGESRGYGVNNTNLLYIISVASTTDKISYEAN